MKQRRRKNTVMLPRGTGSVQKRGLMYWAIFRDPQGRVIQENLKTQDYDLAVALLLERSLTTARARVAELEALYAAQIKTVAEAEPAAAATEGTGDTDAVRIGGRRPRILRGGSTRRTRRTPKTGGTTK